MSNLLVPGAFHWLVVSSLLFSIGVYGLLTRRNAVGVLMSVELSLNSAALNFVLLNRFFAPGKVDGAIMALFIVTVAAAEAVVGMAIFVALYRQRKSVDVNRMNMMSG
ncbi:MAG: NADH-quinone oxidoreductase subunit NuoK [Bdellovibrionota bacterium]